MQSLLTHLRNTQNIVEAETELVAHITGTPVKVMSNPTFEVSLIDLIRIAKEEKPLMVHQWTRDDGKGRVCLTTNSPFVTIYSTVE